MLRHLPRVSSLVLFVPLTACTGMGGGPAGLETRQALLELNAKGTPVSAFVAIDPISCSEGAPQFRLSGEVTATEALSHVELVVAIDGVEHSRQPLATADSLDKKGDHVGATIEDHVAVPSGKHTVHMCLSQKGEKAAAQKGACVPEFVYESACDETTAPAEDTTRPTIAVERDSQPNENGWYSAPVTVDFACEDAESGIQSCSAPVTLSNEGVEHFAKGQAKDVAGNTAGRAEGPIRIDMTPPTITFPGARDYGVDEVIELSCVVEDALSGVKQSSCMASMGEAFLLPVGTHTVSGRAVDLAGNAVEASAEFSVSVSSDSLCALAERFSTKAGIANSLCAKLLAASASIARGNTKAAEGQLGAFENEVQAQTGKAISAAHAGVLLSLVDGLRVTE